MKYEGEVREFELIAALVELGAESFTGALRFENDSIIKIVYFKEGAVLSASTNDRSDSIDEILLKSGKVSREHVKQALTKRKDEETLGDALLGLGFITRKELSWARRVQLIGILRSITTWDAGTYTLVADYLPKREEGPAFQLEQIVLELVLTESDRSKYETLLESGAVVFRPSAVFDEKFPKLGLNQEAAAVVQLINGSRTASDVVAESTSDAFNVYKLIHALHILGLLDKVSSGMDLGLGSPAEAPAIEPTMEMPMDFGIDVGKDEQAASDEFDFGASASPGVDLSWQEPGEPASDQPPSSSQELLPSVDEPEEEAGGGYDYEPSVPDSSAPPVILAEDLPPQEAIPVAEPPAPSPAPARVPSPRAAAGGSGGGRKIAFLVVGLVIIGAIAYAGYVYFMKPGSDTEPAAVVAQETAAPVGASAGEEPPTETPQEEAIAASESGTPGEPVSPASEPETSPPPAARTVPSPPTAGAGGQYSDAARANLSVARGVPFTIQFALLCQDYSIENAVKVGGSEFWFIPINYQGRNCYRAFWGRYTTRADAERGVATIPSSLRGGKAVVVEPSRLSP